MTQGQRNLNLEKISSAIQEGDIRALLKELSHPQVSVNDCNSFGHTALYYAILYGKFNVCQTLLSTFHELDINSIDNFGNTPLMNAAKFGHYEICELLLKHPRIHINLYNKNNQTALSMAAKSRQTRIQSLLEAYGAKEFEDASTSNRDISYTGSTQDQLSPRHYLTDHMIQDFQIPRPVNINYSDAAESPLHILAYGGILDECEELLRNPNQDINVLDKFGNTPLHLAIYYEHIEIVDLLLKKPQIAIDKPNQFNETPLKLAISNNSYHMCNLLLSKNILNINRQDQNGDTPLHYAVAYKAEEIVRLLLADYRINVNIPNSRGLTPVCQAAGLGHRAICEQLLRRSGTKTDVPDHDANNIFHYAILQDQYQICQSLLNFPRPYVNQANRLGFTPFALAVELQRENICKLLINSEKGIDINRCYSPTTSPLFLALRGGNVRICELMIKDFRTDWGKQDAHGNGPLHWAVLYGNLDVVQMLLSLDQIQIGKTNKEGKNVLQLAEQMGNTDVFLALRERWYQDVFGDRRKAGINDSQEKIGTGINLQIGSLASSSDSNFNWEGSQTPLTTKGQPQSLLSKEVLKVKDSLRSSKILQNALDADPSETESNFPGSTGFDHAPLDNLNYTGNFAPYRRNDNKQSSSKQDQDNDFSFTPHSTKPVLPQLERWFQEKQNFQNVHGTFPNNLPGSSQSHQQNAEQHLKRQLEQKRSSFLRKDPLDHRRSEEGREPRPQRSQAEEKGEAPAQLPYDLESSVAALESEYLQQQEILKTKHRSQQRALSREYPLSPGRGPEALGDSGVSWRELILEKEDQFQRMQEEQKREFDEAQRRFDDKIKLLMRKNEDSMRQQLVYMGSQRRDSGQLRAQRQGSSSYGSQMETGRGSLSNSRGTGRAHSGGLQSAGSRQLKGYNAQNTPPQPQQPEQKEYTQNNQIDNALHSFCIVCQAEKTQIGVQHGATVHFCLCKECSRLYDPKIQSSRGCPICRQKISQLVEIFVS